MKATTDSTRMLATGLEVIFRGGAAGSSGDELLRRFVASGDENAFSALVKQHGPMVLGVCRRILGPGSDADDAFQATLLVLLRRARSLQGIDALGPWLHGVAWRVATRARAENQRRKAEESRGILTESAEPSPGSLAEAAEVRAILDEELGRLPEKYRVPIVLCCLEGMSREAAAERLRWRTGVLRGRLQRGRDRLRDRLIRRGLAPALAAGSVEAIETPAKAAVGHELLAATLAAVGAVTKEVTPTAAATLAGAFLRGQIVSRMAIVASVLALAGLAVGTFSAIVLAAGSRADEALRAAQQTPQDVPAQKARTFEVKVVGPGSKPIPEGTVEFQTTPPLVKESVRRGGYVGKGPFGTAVTTDGDGVFVVELPVGCNSLKVFVKKRGYGRFFADWSSQEHEVVIPDRVTADLAPAGPIGGVIVDPDGKPVEGATVRCVMDFKSRPELALPMSYDESARTDREGKWRVEDIPVSIGEVSGTVIHPSFRRLQTLFPRGKFSLDDGREPSARITLDRGVTISGKVTDEAGRPITGAIVRARFDADDRETRTAEDGSYRLEGCEPRMARIVVLAKGHAMDMKELRVDAAMGPVDFALKPAVGLKVKVLDAAGKPVPRARIFFQRWRGMPQNFDNGIRGDTDANGIWSWDEAPLDESTVSILPQVGLALPDQPIPARDSAKILTFRLPPPLILSGQVVDAETKEPIKAFRVAPRDRGDANKQQSSNDLESFPASNGRFEYRPSHPEAVILVRVEADGYASVVSREVRRDEGNVSLRFELTKSRGLLGKVLTPKKQVAAGAEIAIGVEGSQIVIENGTFFEPSTRGFSRRVTADDLGRFSLPAQAGDFQLVIVHPKGYAWIDSPATWETVRLIRLEPWARIEGTFRVGAKPTAHVPIIVNVLPDRPAGAGNKAPRYPQWRHETVSGPDGRFVFERVLPGRGTIQRMIMSAVDEGATEVASTCRIRVELPGGQTTKFDLGGSGRALVGRLELPAGSGDKIPWNFANVGGIRLAPGNREGLPQLAATVSMDGRFRIDDVPPGRYQLIARFRSNDAIRRRGLERLSCARTIEIPAPDHETANGPVDLGVMKMEKR